MDRPAGRRHRSGARLAIAAWALVTGAFELAAAIRLRKHIAGEWLLGFKRCGIGVIFGILLVIFPLAGALTIASGFRVYAAPVRGSLIGLGIRLRMVAKRSP